VSNPVRDRSGVGLPPKAERRAAGKAAAAARARAKRRKAILKNVGSAAAVIVVVAAVAVACTKLATNPTTPAANPTAAATATAPAAEPSIAVDPSFDQALKTKPTVTGGTGDVTKLTATPLITGPGAAIAAGQSITVNYVGVTYVDGKEFDSSWSHNTQFTFVLGQGKVIQGWDQGLVGVKVGSRVQLDIPVDLAYGPDAASQGNPPGALRFVVDILAAK
jgi:peptidylprolyl isomerase